MEQFKLHNRFHSLGLGLSEACLPEGINRPRLVKFNAEVARLVGLSSEVSKSEEFLRIFSGQQTVKGSTPVAQSYAGHQFGMFNPFLGDGRSVLLGEIDFAEKSWDVTLKGSGKTPFTFQSDGHASLKECLHEYAISEQLASHGVPVTRCLSVIQGAEQVYRSGFEPAAILARIASSNIRFGSFENCYFRKDTLALQKLADYVIEYHFPECLNGTINEKVTINGENDYAQFFQQVVTRTARLIAHWQRVGFVHGMMNTDNQSIVGITLDLGESVFIEERDDDFVAARSDTKGRYAFGQQPTVGLWNCNVLARSLSPLISSKDLKKALSSYEETFLDYSSA